jgi:hypothetical protein
MIKAQPSQAMLDRILRALKSRPMTKQQFIEAQGLSKTHPTCYEAFNRLHPSKIRIVDWNRNKGGPPAAVYALQTDPPIPDAPKPVPRTREEQRELDAQRMRDARRPADSRLDAALDPGEVPFVQRWVSAAHAPALRTRGVASVFDLGR